MRFADVLGTGRGKGTTDPNISSDDLSKLREMGVKLESSPEGLTALAPDLSSAFWTLRRLPAW